MLVNSKGGYSGMYTQELNKTVVRDIYNTIHEGVLEDVINITQRGTRAIQKWGPLISSSPRTGSLVKRSSQYILVFPVIVSSTISVSTSIMISKAIEKKCCSLLQILFSAINLTSYNNSRDLEGYLAKFHTNLNTEPGVMVSLDDFINSLQAIKTRREDFVIDKEVYDNMIHELSNINNIAKDHFNEIAIHDYIITKPYSEGGASVSTIRRAMNKLNPFKKKPVDGDKRSDGVAPEKFDKPKDASDYYGSQVIKQDYTKANELMPTNMIINFVTLAGDNNDKPINRTAVIGVKAKLYPVESSEIIDKIAAKYMSGNTLMDLIQVSTGEKSFLRDFVFCLDKLKSDAVTMAKKSINGKIFELLERRAEKHNSLMMKNGDSSPITTLIISQEEVEYLKKYHKIDVDSGDVINKIFNGYNLMGIVITDDSTETARFLFDDGERMYQTLSYKVLEKDSGDSTYKQIVNLMSKVAR